MLAFNFLSDLILGLGIAALLGGILGWGREIHGRPAGQRTHMLLNLRGNSCLRNFFYSHSLNHPR